MSSVIVACPKCSKRQEVGGPVPADGLRHVCAFCGAQFMVKLPPGRAAAPPLPDLADLGLDGLDLGGTASSPGGLSLPDDYGNGGTVAMTPGSASPFDRFGADGFDAPGDPLEDDGMTSPATQVDAGADEYFGLDGPEEAPPAPAARDHQREPSAQRLAMPSASFTYEDLLASRENVPPLEDPPARPVSAPEPARAATRGSKPASDPRDLPAARESIPLWDDFLAPREAVPRPSDLPAARESMPLPGDFLAPREAVPRPGDLPAARESMPLPGDFLAPREAVPRPGDLLSSRDSMPRPGDVLQPVGATGRPANLPTSRGGFAGPPVPPDAAKARPAGRGAGTAATPKLDFDPFADELPPAPSSPLEELDFAAPGGTAADAAANGAPLPDAEIDGGFSLELEGGRYQASDEAVMPAPPPVDLRSPPTVIGDDSAVIPQLSPPRRSKQAEFDEPVTPQSRRRLFVVAGASVALAGVAVLAGVLVVSGGTGVGPRDVLEPLAAELARDHYPVYQRAADQLIEAANESKQAAALRAAAAEQMLMAVLAHGGERSKVSRAEQLVAALPPPGDHPLPEAARARALLSVARGKGSDVVDQLGEEASTPDGQLVTGLRDLTAGKRAPAAAAFRKVVAARPELAVTHYLLGRALEETKGSEAVKSYQAVLARNKDHFGAALGLARLAAGPAQRLAAVQQLLGRKLKGVAPGELAEAHVLLGRAAQAEGRALDAAAAFNHAVGTDPLSVPANIALGEMLMLEGRHQDALARFQAMAPTGLRTPAGKFGVGGALIATGKVMEGMAQVRQAAQESPADPRGLFHAGVAAEVGTPVDLESAAQNYRAALKLDGAFLPATLRLAALLQKLGRAQDALAVLRDAERAGAPPTALQIAWGEALIVAREPARAEEVFRAALATNPGHVPAHLGLAGALEAQGNIDAAKHGLEKTIAAIPDAVGVREKLAALCVKAGKPDEAMAHYQAEIASGRASLALRVSLAKLALDLGRLDEAQKELEGVTQKNLSTPDALFTLARVWEARGDQTRALQEYRRALRFGGSPALQLAFARALVRAGKESEAMNALDEAASLPQARIERGRALYRKGDYEKALADFQEGSRLEPRNAEALLWKGLAHDKLGETDKAADAWRAALKLTPGDPETHYRLGKYELDKGHATIGVEHLRKAATAIPEKAEWKAEFYFQLATGEVTGGSKIAALAAYRKYLTLAPADAASRPEVERQIRRLAGR